LKDGIKYVVFGFIATCFFWIIGICFGLSLDIDHLFVLILKGIPITWENLATQSGRPFHIVGVIVAWISFILVFTRIARLWSN